MPGNASDFVAAYFEKSSGATDSGFTQALTSLKFQRRFFIFSDSQKMLYYFKVGVIRCGVCMGIECVGKCGRWQ